jgi:hypothetical protein
MDAATIEKLTAERKETPNILAPAWTGRFSEGDKGLFLAGPPVRAMAQNLIDHAAGSGGELVHAHLAESRILVLMRTGQKPNADALLELGRQSKASGLIKMLSDDADFVMTLNGDAWGVFDGLDEGEEPTADDFAQQAVRNLDVLDHELTHAMFTVGKKVFKFAKKNGWAKRDGFVKQLGGDLVGTETEDEISIVRFVKRRPEDDGTTVRPPLTEDQIKAGIKPSRRCWRIRKHDHQDWFARQARWGMDAHCVRDLAKAFEEAGSPLSVDPTLVGAPA